VIIAPFVAIVSAIVFFWSGLKYQRAYYALIELLPLEFQDPLTSRYAAPSIAFHPGTPLAVQTNFIQAQIGFCCAVLGFSLSGFLFGNFIVGGVCLVMFLVIAPLTIKIWKTYASNRKQAVGRIREA
jgi:hypothetical protein